MCQLRWDMGFSDILLNILLGMSVRVFLDGVNIWGSRLSSTRPCSSMWVGGHCPAPGDLSRTRGRGRENSLFLFKLRHWFFSYTWTGTYTIRSSVLQVFRPEWGCGKDGQYPQKWRVLRLIQKLKLASVELGNLMGAGKMRSLPQQIKKLLVAWHDFILQVVEIHVEGNEARKNSQNMGAWQRKNQQWQWASHNLPSKEMMEVSTVTALVLQGIEGGVQRRPLPT